MKTAALHNERKSENWDGLAKYAFWRLLTVAVGSGLTILSDLRAVGATIVVRRSRGTVDVLEDEAGGGGREGTFLAQSLPEDLGVHHYHHDRRDPE